MNRAAGKILPLLLLLAPPGLAGQKPLARQTSPTGQTSSAGETAPAAQISPAAPTVLTISPEQCVWRSGDNPAWAAPNLDESGWQPYSSWQLNPSDPRIWVRCAADLSALRKQAHPAIQVGLDATYELYLNGTRMGSQGDLHWGTYSTDTYQTFPADPRAFLSGGNAIALRIVCRNVECSPAELSAGDAQLLHQRRDSVALEGLSGSMQFAACYLVIGVLGFMLLGLYLNGRGRPELLLLAMICWGLCDLREAEFLRAALVPVSSIPVSAMLAFGQFVALIEGIFYFKLARRRIPLFFILVFVVASSHAVLLSITLFLPAAPALRLAEFHRTILPYQVAVGCLVPIIPFFAFWPWRRIAPGMRLVAACCILWGAVDTFWLGSVVIAGVDAPFSAWFDAQHSALLDLRAFVTAATLVALQALLYREQRNVAGERAMLSGEMQSAREIQRRLVPATPPAVAGFHIEAVYLPAQEVGGDFYQIFEQPGGRSMVVVGDVSGKGLKAAMTGALVIGALRALAREDLGPAALLDRLNREMVRSQDDGFITCLCARFSSDGDAAFANAGHLAPYRNGEEIPIASGLPLGVTAEAEYAETFVRLSPGDTLTLLSDGVVEARNKSGELFGFERAARLSAEPAATIAQAAQAHGQEDDITVLTLTLAPVGAAHA
jgi:serine phosphatase RsbU (regulator of sigma subunit)